MDIKMYRVNKILIFEKSPRRSPFSAFRSIPGYRSEILPKNRTSSAHLFKTYSKSMLI